MSVRKELDGKLLKGNPIKIFDRRTTSDRRGETNHRVKDVRRKFEDRHHDRETPTCCLIKSGAGYTAWFGKVYNDNEAMEAIKKAKEIAPSTPIIIVTGSINEDTAFKCFKAGVVDYVIKENLMHLNTQ